ncbi:MAG TPA: acyl-phosphate glycerol 3-phosphate acyltransferase [Elusimicrobia bacterium]|nr:acyl-phosphate glycerol 3-phosphate acyltransferase [Elusimicrobiota bacterium]
MITLILLLSFLLGAIPTAYLIAKIFYGIDIRKFGSGNPGATNVWRTVGKIPGTLTFLFDVLKGFIPVFIARKIFPEPSLTYPMLSGFCAVAGHIWTPFLKFRGGKGVATGFGVFLGLIPIATFFALIVFIITLALTKYVALGSIAASISLPVFLYFLKRPPVLIYVSVILAVIIIWRHKSNIKKILNKNED